MAMAIEIGCRAWVSWNVYCVGAKFMRSKGKSQMIKSFEKTGSFLGPRPRLLFALILAASGMAPAAPPEATEAPAAEKVLWTATRPPQSTPVIVLER
jgi:hypothetical protein